MDVIVYRTDESGELTPGWLRLYGGRMLSYVDHMIEEGIAARSALSATDPKRREIGDWINTLQTKGYLRPGCYALRGKAVVHVEDATTNNRIAAQQRSAIISAQYARERRLRSAAASNRTTPSVTKSTPQSVSAAIAKAKKALAA